MKRIAGASIPAMILLLCMTAQVAFSAEVKQQRLNLTLKAVSFPEAIRQLFAGSKERYSVDPALRDLKVTANLKNTVREQAIKVVCGTAGVVYRVENGTYYFSPRPAAVTVSGDAPAPSPPRGSTKTEMVMLRFISAADAAALLNASPPDGLLSITATNSNALMIKGDQDSIDQATRMIRLFDVEDALPRSVRITLSLNVKSAGVARPIHLTAQSVGLEGSQMPLGISSSGGKSGSIVLEVKLTPTVGTDGSISLVGSGAIDCSIPHAGETVRLSRSLQVAIAVNPDTPTDIAAGASGDITEAAEFIVSVTAVVEKGRVAAPKGGPVSTLGTPAPGGAVVPAMAATRPDEAHRQAADTLLQQIWNAEQGQPTFEAIDAVVARYKASDEATQNAIAWLCLEHMKDEKREVYRRWPCCYVPARAKCMESVGRLIEVMLRDEAETMRAVAAEALGGLYTETRGTTKRDSLLQAARTDQSTWVRDTIARYIPSSSTN